MELGIIPVILFYGVNNMDGLGLAALTNANRLNISSSLIKEIYRIIYFNVTTLLNCFSLLIAG